MPSLTVLKQTSKALKNTLTVDITFIAMFLMIPFSVSQEKNKAYLVQEQQYYWGQNEVSTHVDFWLMDRYVRYLESLENGWPQAIPVILHEYYFPSTRFGTYWVEGLYSEEQVKHSSDLMINQGRDTGYSGHLSQRKDRHPPNQDWGGWEEPTPAYLCIEGTQGNASGQGSHKKRFGCLKSQDEKVTKCLRHVIGLTELVWIKSNW